MQWKGVFWVAISLQCSHTNSAACSPVAPLSGSEAEEHRGPSSNLPLPQATCAAYQRWRTVEW